MEDSPIAEQAGWLMGLAPRSVAGALLGLAPARVGAPLRFPLFRAAAGLVTRSEGLKIGVLLVVLVGVMALMRQRPGRFARLDADAPDLL